MSSSVSGFMILLAAIAAEVVATLSLRASHGLTRLTPSIVSLLGYGLALWGLAVASRTVPLSISYPLWAGLGTAGALIGARILYEERLAAGQWVGIALVALGSVLANVLSTRGTA